MSAELAAQKAICRALWAQLQLLRSKRARKSKAYRDLETRLRAANERYDALQAKQKKE